ncbi:hypothetical protein HYDPIDRAFT_29938 [Hydnomerulius pinastri MD-312]|uniref:DUF6697 domain-containing protein n=1 Tax=Hydnomerulius pinastri MD-312 TaxID=994086 RepID=A0A0C9WDV5_9AGAM|nr:hypothetical protein HYDPIDRAFT_29938 [Hydnomerulius pinastri MD-312]
MEVRVNPADPSDPQMVSEASSVNSVVHAPHGSPLKRIKKEEVDDLRPLASMKFEEDVRAEPHAPVPKRRRVNVEVVVPTRRQVYGEELPAFEDASSFIARHFGDIVKKEEEKFQYNILHDHIEAKVKKEEVMSDDVVHRRLALIGHATYNVRLDPVIRDVTTTRLFTSSKWGGNTQETFPFIGKPFLDRHGLDDFMYLNLLYNPHAPRWPGAPGLFFGSSVRGADADEWPKIQRTIVRLKTNVWLYVGQYKCTPAPSLTSDEWRAQAPRVQQTWVSKIMTQGWGKIIRANIILQRRLQRDPTLQELHDAVQSNEAFSVSADAIYQAFEEGHAVLRSWCMKCTGYDENFQREIAAGNGQ